jgi:hypothetical protein
MVASDGGAVQVSFFFEFRETGVQGLPLPFANRRNHMRLALFLMVAGCAHEESRPTPRACSIAELDFPAADNDYSKPLTAATLDKLNLIIRADRDAFRAGGTNLGVGLGDLATQLDKGPFVAKGALETATRLRQLDCAIQRGMFNGRSADADQLYGEILGEVEKELKLARAQ